MAFKMNGFPAHKGSSMAKNMKDGSYKQSFENAPAKQKVDPPRDPGDRGVEVRYDNETQEYVPIGTPRKIKIKPEIEIKRPAKRKATIPIKQKLNKGGEGQDQDKIMDEKGNHIGDYINGKKVMLKKGMSKGISKLTPKQIKASKSNKPMATIAKQSITGPDKPHGEETLTDGFTSDSDYEGIVNDKKNSRSYIRKYDVMTPEELDKAKIKNVGQTIIKTKGDNSKTARRIKIKEGKTA